MTGETRTTRWPVAVLVVAAAFFGVAPTGTKYAMGGFGPVTVLTIELVAAGGVLWLVVLTRGYRRPASLGRVFLLGVLEPGLAYLFVSFGLQLTTASNAALLGGLECGFVVILAALFLHERAGWSVIAAVGIAVLGMVVLEGSVSFGAPGLGDLLMTAGTLSAAVYTIVARRLSPGDDPLTVTALQFTVGSALVLPLAVCRWSTGAEQIPIGVPMRFWTAAALVGVLGFGASFVLYNAAIVRIAAGPAGVIINLAPAFGLASAVLWLGETLTTARAVGAALIGLSVVLFISVERGNQLAARRSRDPVPVSELPRR